MNSSSLRRLASDHASLHKSDLPPNYLFPPSSASIPDDLTQLTILLAGPQGTPYSAGVWKLHLKIPQDYPKSPPKASFRTKIWHPNVEESTGSICVETLKRDWQPKLTLRDVLITISCLLIQPNPDSALNATAGKLLQEDYESFARQAKLMTSIHAPVSSLLKEAVLKAQRRGEEGLEASTTLSQAQQNLSVPPISFSKKAESQRAPSLPSIRTQAPSDAGAEASDDEDSPESSFKENDPSLSPSPVSLPPPNVPRPILGKRPLSDLPTPPDPDAHEDFNESRTAMSPSEVNVANNSSTPNPNLRNSWSHAVTPPAQNPLFTTHQQPRKLVVSRPKNASFTFKSPSPTSIAHQSTSASASASASTASSFTTFASTSFSITTPTACSSNPSTGASVPAGLAILSCDLESRATSTVEEEQQQQQPARKRVCSQEEKARVEEEGEEKENRTVANSLSHEAVDLSINAIIEPVMGLTRPVTGFGLHGRFGTGGGGVMANKPPNAGIVRGAGGSQAGKMKLAGKPRVGIRRL